MPVYQVAPGIYRGPAPRTNADYQRLKQLGIKTVLNLRKRDQSSVAGERSRLAAMGIATRHVPMDYFPRGDGSVEQALRVMHDPGVRPLYIHCKHGRDRSGLIVGLFRVQGQGWNHSRAYQEMTGHGFNTRLFGLRRYFWRTPAGQIPMTPAPTNPIPSSPAQIAGGTNGKNAAPRVTSQPAAPISKSAPTGAATTTSFQATPRQQSGSPNSAKPVR